MNERFIYLTERYFEGKLSEIEKEELGKLLNSSRQLNEEFNEQKKIKEVLDKMKLKNPSKEVWDSYWLNIYNRIERKIAWIVVLIGVSIVLGYASFHAVENFIADQSTPFILKIGITALLFGFLVLLFSVLREKLFVSKKDKYKEIER